MTNDEAGRRASTDVDARRSDFTNALVAVGVTAALVVAVVWPASRHLRPGTLLDGVAVPIAATSVPEAPTSVITTAAHRERPATAPGAVLTLEGAPAAAAAATSACVPCLRDA